MKLENDIPSEDTFWRIMRVLKSSELEKSMKSCAFELFNQLENKQLCIDGKELRGTTPSGKKHALVQSVSVWVGSLSLSFGQVAVAEKSNEITAIPAVLATLEAPGSIITIDAIGCQKEIVRIIVEKKCDYVIALKKNQGTLYEQVSDWMEKQKGTIKPFETIEKGHGRIETRKVYVCENHHEFLESTNDWNSLNTLIMVERTRWIKEIETTSKVFYISSLINPSSEDIGLIVRNHWSIENQLHWQLDVTFNEDKSQIKKDNGPENMNIFRKFALHILAKIPNKVSKKRNRKKAARSNEFLIQILKN